MRAFSFWRVFVVAVGACCFAPGAFSQSTLDKTTLGKSQNSSADLVNSLVPGPQKFGKGEKKSEVDPKTLTSKKTNDTTFSGSLNDIGLDWSGDKMGKPHANSAAEPKTAKQSDADLKKTTTKSTEAGDNAQSKEPKSAASKPEKQSEKEKPSDSGGR